MDDGSSIRAEHELQATFVCAAASPRETRRTRGRRILDGVRRAPDAEARLHRELEVRIRQSLAANLRAIDH